MYITAFVLAGLMSVLFVYSVYGACMATYYLRKGAEFLLQVPDAYRNLRAMRERVWVAVVATFAGAGAFLSLGLNRPSYSSLPLTVMVYALVSLVLGALVYSWSVEWWALRKPLYHRVRSSVAMHS